MDTGIITRYNLGPPQLLPCKKIPSKLSPMTEENLNVSTRHSSPNLADAELGVCEDRQPAQRGPHAVLLPHVVRPRPKALFATDREDTRVHQIAKELPPCSISRGFM